VKNNDILRSIRYSFDLNDAEMIAIFGAAGLTVTRGQVSDWLKKEHDPAFKNCSDKHLAVFLNGLIIHRRGRREGPPSAMEQRLTNNSILKKIKIALDLKSEDMARIMATAQFSISQHEISALLRNPDNKHYRLCKDQILRNFLKGIQRTYRPDAPPVE
jgi:uncharacterized protein YehS (DUF1456 family)